MHNSSRKIFAIQDNEKTLIPALKIIKGTENNLLIRNCISMIKLGEKKLHSVFDTLLYNDEKNILIMLRDSSKITPDMFVELLEQNDTKYNELNFMDYPRYDRPETSKEIYFATNLSGFKHTLKTSIENGNDKCTYHPSITGYFSLKYFYNKKLQEQLDYYYIRGVLELEDKIILIVSQRTNDDLYYKNILHELEKKNFEVTLDYSNEIEETLRKKVIIKKTNYI